ncbi:MAG: hypothetical protein J6Y80_06085, partial [Victivallales bacterium]|nr:hypothetical protein [Victivallales bacterium]
MFPRPEYPRPQFRRDEWLNCNGEWEFALDGANFDRVITVPFAPESSLSGVHDTAYHPHVAYRRQLAVPAAWAGRHVLMHFGGVDYAATVFFDGKAAGYHQGGSTPFTVELPADAPGRAVECRVEVMDDLRSGTQGGGKQAWEEPGGCIYTRVTGIWRTVWLEPVFDNALAFCRIQCSELSEHTARLHLTPQFHSCRAGCTLNAAVCENGHAIAQGTCRADGHETLELALSAPHRWSPEDPFMYNRVLEVRQGEELLDRVESVAAVRTVECRNGRLLLTGRPRFLRFVLDQGYWPDGLWTAPDESALVHDLELAHAFGFNGARLHQKVFDERLLDYADRHGFLVSFEYPSWGMDLHLPEARYNFLHEWAEVVRLYANHPSIVIWTPLNETFLFPTPENLRTSFPDLKTHVQYQEFVKLVVQTTKGLDPTRPVMDSSGWYHVETDLWSAHLYQSDADGLKRNLDCGNIFVHVPDYECKWSGQPFFVDEWGGFQYIDGHAPEENSWGYGDRIREASDYLRKIAEQLEVLLAAPQVAGYCYTQLVDVEQEQNGLADANRVPKLPPEKFHRLFS